MVSLQEPRLLSTEERLRGHVILVHGIESDGRWMDEAVPLLSPFFKTTPVHYEHFRFLGPLKLLFEPYSLVVVIVAAWLFSSQVNLWVGLVCAGGGLVASRFLARRQLDSAVENFVTRFSREAAHIGRPTHVIAHSLGTFLMAIALQRFQGIHLGRVILCGCVLPRDYPWEKFRRAGRLSARVASIRNEVGLRDLVPVLAHWSRLLGGPPFGTAGRKGFTGSPKLIHDVAEGSAQCERCLRGEEGFLHNVPLDFAHSTGFVGGNQCKNFWVPFLLDCDPTEFRYLMTLCAACFDAQGRTPEIISVSESELRDEWRWCKGRLDGELRKRISGHPRVRLEEVESLVDAAIPIFWGIIARAQEEPWPGGNPAIIRMLDPITALQRTVEATVEAYVE